MKMNSENVQQLNSEPQADCGTSSQNFGNTPVVRSQLETNKIYHGNCLDVLKTFPDNCIDCCITSPPYWGLRDYEHEQQLGNETHFNEFIENLCNIFDEVKRVLKDEGTCFINLGDTYGGSGAGTTKFADTNKYLEGSKQVYILPNGVAKSNQFRNGSLNKSLLLIPERFAIEMLNRKWILRNEIIWHKPNQMPASVTDRFTVDFEKIFFFTKKPNYFFEQQLEKSIWAEFDKRSQIKGGRKSNGKTATGKYATNKVAYAEGGMRNVRTVWSINTEPCFDGHFATYPQRLVERMIKAGCPEFICNNCGKPRLPIIEKEYVKHENWFGEKQNARHDRGNAGNSYNEIVGRSFKGLTDCGCNAGFSSGIVLDPFFGSGTTGIYARKANRNFVGIELNEKYIEIANKRLSKELGMFR